MEPDMLDQLEREDADLKRRFDALAHKRNELQAKMDAIASLREAVSNERLRILKERKTAQESAR